MKTIIHKSIILPAPAEKLYEMFLSSKHHTALTGAPAKISSRAGSSFTAFNGELWGKTICSVKPNLIIQSWRSSSFKDKEPDSTLIISFIPQGKNGKIDLIHLDVPDYDYDGVKEGWDHFYFIPWRKYLKTLRK
jgi:activator of HSP90 ATPase